MKTLHKIRIFTGLALFGAVVAGVFFGATEHADTFRFAGAAGSIALAKILHLV